MNRRSSRLVPAAALFAAVLSAAPALAETRVFDVEPFDAIEASNGIVVEAVIGDAPALSAEGPADKLEEIYVDISRGRLVVRPSLHPLNTNQIDMSDTIVRLVVSSVDDIEVENGARLALSGLDVADIELEATNGGVLRVEGVCASADMVARRGGVLDARELRCGEVKARASTGGVVHAYASEGVDAGVSVGGAIDVAGSPSRVKRNRSLTGSINIR
jgi:hypothetical protein